MPLGGDDETRLLLDVALLILIAICAATWFIFGQ